MAARLFACLCLLIFLAGCALYAQRRLDERFGRENPARFDQMVALPGKPEYRHDVKPILDNRCVVCHGCYDAPCQLQLGSYEGITRGASKRVVYDGTRLFRSQPTRLFHDAQTNVEWRQLRFHPVLNERANEPEANRDGSLLYQFLDMKRTTSWPTEGILPADKFELGLDREQQCATINEFERLQRRHPEWGMPYGLPPLTDKEHEVVAGWIEAGAPAVPPKPPTPAQVSQIAEWERFLNDDSLKSQLMARYLFEHWFLAHLYFDDLPVGDFFELVRSKTPPGQPIDLISTRLPFDDPVVSRVYYRLRPIHFTLVDKTHMPYGLSRARMERLKAWFLDPPYRVSSLPGYQPYTTGNPFLVFIDLPIEARYRFLLDEAQFSVMNFIKGPVCRGQVAVDVIGDHFWVLFIDPKIIGSEFDTEFLRSSLPKLRLPNTATSARFPIQNWLIHSRMQADYLRAKSEFIYRTFQGDNAIDLNMTWNGDGHNPNAALTVFRHFDSASVVKGLVGDEPETIWVLGYPLLERIHYLLVAGFDVFGNVGHQANSRLYMDFLRIEAELNFLTLMPRSARQPLLDRWYRATRTDVTGFLRAALATLRQESGIRFQTSEPYKEIQGMLKERFEPILERRYELTKSDYSEAELFHLKRLAGFQGRALSFLPEAAFVTLLDEQGHARHLSLVHNSAHSNVEGLFDEENRRLPDEDTLTVANGPIGAYPNALYEVPTKHLAEFVDAVKQLASENDYARLAERFAVRRTSPAFWQHSDRLHEARARAWPLEASMFDYNRLENR